MSVEDERAVAPDGLRKIRGEERAGFCTACEARPSKRIFFVGMRELCWTCAKEIAYGIVPHGLPLHGIGGGGSLNDRDDDANGGLSNGRRALEDP